MEKKVNINLSPEELAEAYWDMDSGEQADFYNHLFKCSEGSHRLIWQHLDVREECEKRKDRSLEAFQYMFASAFKYMIT